MLSSAYARTGRGSAWGRRTVVLAVVAGVCAATACGTSDDDGPTADGKPSAAEEQVKWRPWQTTFHGGKGRGNGPGANFERVCLRGTVPAGAQAEADVLGGGTAFGNSRDEGPLHCRVTGSRDQSLRFGDGRSSKDTPAAGQSQDTGRLDGVVTNVKRPDAELGDDELSAYSGKARALRAEDREVVWEKDVRSTSVYDSGVVIGDELTDIVNTPEDDSYEDWSAEFAPGGDLIAWDAASGDEKWRVEAPTKKDLCSPLKAGEKVLVTCDRGVSTPRVWYALDQDEQKLTRLHEESGDGGESGFVGMDGDALVFLPSEIMTQDLREFTELVRVDSRSGKKERRKLPGSLPKGAEADLLHGDLYFRDPLGRGSNVRVVDAATGKERWQRKLTIQDPSAPTVSTEHDEVYVVDPAGRILALDRGSGREKWRTKPRAEDGGTKPAGLYALSSVNLVDDVLVVATGNTVFTVTPDEPDAEPETTHRVDLGSG